MSNCCPSSRLTRTATAEIDIIFARMVRPSALLIKIYSSDNFDGIAVAAATGSASDGDGFGITLGKDGGLTSCESTLAIGRDAGEFNRESTKAKKMRPTVKKAHKMKPIITSLRTFAQVSLVPNQIFSPALNPALTVHGGGIVSRIRDFGKEDVGIGGGDGGDGNRSVLGDEGGGVNRAVGERRGTDGRISRGSTAGLRDDGKAISPRSRNWITERQARSPLTTFAALQRTQLPVNSMLPQVLHGLLVPLALVPHVVQIHSAFSAHRVRSLPSAMSSASFILYLSLPLA